MILNVHGGPHSQFSPAFFHELQMYPAHGFALVYINPRGSLGYDESFAQEVVAAWGEADAPDFLAAVDHAVSMGGIDCDESGHHWRLVRRVHHQLDAWHDGPVQGRGD